MLHPYTELRLVNAEIGVGVFACRAIACGTLVWVLDEFDQVITAQRAGGLSADYDDLLNKYAYHDRDGNWVLTWDNARLINHSCAANCLATDHGFDLAVRDISPGEQITIDYGTLHLTAPESFACRCQADGCRGRIAPSADATLRAQWRRQLLRALDRVSQVEQPLALLLPIDALALARAELTFG